MEPPSGFETIKIYLNLLSDENFKSNEKMSQFRKSLVLSVLF